MAAPPASHQGEAGSPLSAYPAPGQGPAVLALLPVQAQGPNEWFGPMSVFTAQSGSCRLLIAQWRDERHEPCNRYHFRYQEDDLCSSTSSSSLRSVLACSSRTPFPTRPPSDLLTSGIRDSILRLRSGSPSPLHPPAEVPGRHGSEFQAPP